MNRKYLIGILIGFIGLTFISSVSSASTFPDIFINVQNYNSNVIFNYGSLIQNASESNNYRNYLDTTIKGKDSYQYDEMTTLTNTVDYGNYLYQQQVYNFNDDSFNTTNGYYYGSYSFENESIIPTGFSLRTGSSSKWSINNHIGNHIDNLMLNDDSSNSQSFSQVFDDIITYGTVDFWFRIESLSGYGGIISLGTDLSEFSSYLYVYGSELRIERNGGYTVLQSISLNQWYHFSYDFECATDGYKGLASNEVSITINGLNYGSYSFANNGNQMEKIVIGSMISAVSTQVSYIDSIGYSWLDNYSIGQNILSEYHENDVYSIYYDDYWYSDEVEYIRDATIIGNYTYLYSGNSFLYKATKSFDVIDIKTGMPITIYSITNNETNIIMLDGMNGLIYIYNTDLELIETLYNEYYYVGVGFTYLNNGSYLLYDYDDNVIRILNSTFNQTNYINNPFGSDTILDFQEYNNELYFLVDSTQVELHVLDLNFNVISDNPYDFLPVNPNNFLIFDDFLFAFKSTSSHFRRYILHKNFITKYVFNQVYFYDDTNTLKGKIEFKFYIQKTKIFVLIDYFYYNSIFYSHDELSRFFVQDYNNSFDLEIQYHLITDFYNNLFKSVMLKITFIQESINESVIYNLDYIHSFDKLKLNSFSYIQENQGNFNFDNMNDINQNYFKNDLFGFRTMMCNDVSQKFDKFYDFGMFNDVININELEIPEEPDDSEISSLPYWEYQVSTIEFDTNNTIASIHFNYSFPMVKIAISIERFNYNPNTLSYLTPYQIIGNFGIFGEWNWVRDIINFVIRVLYLFPNMLVLVINFAILAIYFLVYLFILVIRTLIMTYIVGGMIYLFWNVLVLGLFISFLWFLEAVFYVMPLLFEIFIYIIVPVLIEILTTVISTVISLILYWISGAQVSYTDIYNAVYTLLSVLYDYAYEVLLFIVENLLVILGYIVAYLDTYTKVYIKKLYTKSRGMTGRADDLESTLKIYRKIYEVPLNTVNKIKG